MRYSIYLMFALALSGCMRTVIKVDPITEDVFRLAALGEDEIGLSVTAPGLGSLGSQYLLIALPFGDVELKEPTKFVEETIYRELALRGFRPITDIAELNDEVPLLSVEIKEISVNAYDFLATRKVAANVSITGTLLRNGEPVDRTTKSAEFSEFREDGFEPRLRRALTKAATKATKDLLDELGLALHS